MPCWTATGDGVAVAPPKAAASAPWVCSTPCGVSGSGAWEKGQRVLAELLQPGGALAWPGGAWDPLGGAQPPRGRTQAPPGVPGQLWPGQGPAGMVLPREG